MLMNSPSQISEIKTQEKTQHIRSTFIPGLGLPDTPAVAPFGREQNFAGCLAHHEAALQMWVLVCGKGNVLGEELEGTSAPLARTTGWWMAGAGSSALGDQEIQGHIGSGFFNLAQSPAHGKHSKKKKQSIPISRVNESTKLHGSCLRVVSNAVLSTINRWHLAWGFKEESPRLPWWSRA